MLCKAGYPPTLPEALYWARAAVMLAAVGKPAEVAPASPQGPAFVTAVTCRRVLSNVRVAPKPAMGILVFATTLTVTVAPLATVWVAGSIRIVLPAAAAPPAKTNVAIRTARTEAMPLQRRMRTKALLPRLTMTDLTDPLPSPLLNRSAT
jgi:hypothetical protein